MRDLVRRLIVSLTLLGLVTAPPMAAAAQDDAGSVPGARDCTVEPRTEKEILAIVASATPVAYDTYEEEQAAEWSDVTVLGPADFATQQAVRDTVWQFIVCGNANLPLGVYALWTEDFIADSSVTAEDLDPDTNVDDSGPISLIDVLSVLTLSDGHVVAVVVFDSQDVATPVEAFAFYFEEVDGRWLLDGVAL